MTCDICHQDIDENGDCPDTRPAPPDEEQA
jgi:hypothetical protein